MTKSIPEKSKKCAMLSAAQAQELHGNNGDRCSSLARTRKVRSDSTNSLCGNGCDTGAYLSRFARKYGQGVKWKKS